MIHNHRKAQTYARIIQSLLTTGSDNLKHAPGGDSVIDKIASLANLITLEIISQLNDTAENSHTEASPEQESHRYENTMAFICGTLSHPSDTLSHTASIKEWVKLSVVHGKNLTNQYKI